jgi:hypothetical protein
MWIMRNILEENRDSTFINDLLNHSIAHTEHELIILLTQGRDYGFKKELIDYMFLDYTEHIREIFKTCYHPYFIKKLRDRTINQWYNYRNIAQHLFYNKDDIEYFFTQTSSLYLTKNEIEYLSAKTLKCWYILYATSHIIGEDDALHFIFSAIQPKNSVKDSDMVTFTVKNNHFYSKTRDWLEPVSVYFKNYFSQESICEIMGIDIKKVL